MIFLKIYGKNFSLLIIAINFINIDTKKDKIFLAAMLIFCLAKFMIQ